MAGLPLSPARSRVVPSGCLLLVFVIVSITGCRPFHPSLGELPRLQNLKTVERFPVAGVKLSLAARDTLDENLEAFDCDLLRIGVHPIWIEIENRGPATLRFERSRFRLEKRGGGRAKILKIRQLLDRLYKGYSIRTYLLYARKELERDFLGLTPTLTRLSAGKTTAGYLFVNLGDRQPRALQGATLHWDKFFEEGNSTPQSFLYTFP